MVQARDKLALCTEETRRLGDIEHEILREHNVYKGAFVSVHTQTDSCSKSLSQTRLQMVGCFESAQTSGTEGQDPCGHP